jgi:hypothetical protein
VGHRPQAYGLNAICAASQVSPRAIEHRVEIAVRAMGEGAKSRARLEHRARTGELACASRGAVSGLRRPTGMHPLGQVPSARY